MARNNSASAATFSERFDVAAVRCDAATSSPYNIALWRH
jgi:hypothetical protein